MMTIGGRRVIFDRTFLVADGQETLIDVLYNRDREEDAANTITRLTILFVNDPTVQAPTASWAGAGDRTAITFRGWNSTVPSTIGEPAQIAAIEGRAVFMQLAHSKVGAMNLVHLQLLISPP